MFTVKMHRRQRTQLPALPAAPARADCPLCGRPLIPGPAVDLHHLIPKSQGGRETVAMHRICHRKLHALFSETELARDLHTLEALRAHPSVAAFVRWVRRRPPEFDDTHHRPRRAPR
ncbi:MAG: HNH endonuclease [Methyloversatilis sp.]|nr:HNH endonuclease [Methyloversatilis sp.]